MRMAAPSRSLPADAAWIEARMRAGRYNEGIEHAHGLVRRDHRKLGE
jgi:hypothetical protein